MWTLNNAIDSSPILSFIISQQAKIVVFHGGLAEQLGIDRSSTIGKPAFDISNLPLKKNHFRKAIQGHSFSTSVTIQGRSYETTLTPIRNAENVVVGVSCFTLDVTKSLELEQFLDEERHRLFTSQRLSSLANITQGLAHEINNPLAIICGYAEQLMLLSEQEPFPKDRVQLISQKIHEASHRCSAIIRSLKDFSRDGSNDPFELASVPSMIQDTINVCAQKLQSVGIELHVQCEQQINLIECRSAQIKQVLFNLLTNSIDACQTMEKGRIEIIVETNDSEVKVHIHDNGPGVAETIRYRIFEPFFTTKNVGSGVGVGLSMAKGIVEDHHGKLELLPQTEGSTFTLTLPLQQPRSKVS